MKRFKRRAKKFKFKQKNQTRRRRRCHNMATSTGNDYYQQQPQHDETSSLLLAANNNNNNSSNNTPKSSKIRHYTIQVLAHISLIFVAFIYSSFYIVAQELSLKTFHPFVFAAFRAFPATLILLVASTAIERYQAPVFDVCLSSNCHSKSSRTATLKHTLYFWFAIILFGFTGKFISQIFAAYALTLTSSTSAGILQPVTPVFTAVWGMVMCKERLTMVKFIGIAVTVAASLVMLRVDLFIKNTANFDNMKQLMGNALVLIGSCSTSFSIVLQKMLLDGGIPPLTMTSYSFFVACIMMTLLATPFFGEIHSLAAIPWTAWIGVLYSAVFPSAIAYSLSSWALKHLTPSIRAMYICLQPVFSSLLGYFIQHVKLEWFHAVGAAGIVIGLIIVVIGKALEQQQQKEEQAKHAKGANVAIAEANSERQADNRGIN